LHYVHELTDGSGSPLGIVHRDVTPSNVFVTYDGRVKVVDFGIAKATTCVAQTRMGVLKGKLAYMSPESVRGEAVDRRSDIFSVGVMLWEVATGRRLWRDHDEIGVFRRLATGDLPLQPRGVQIVHPELFQIAQRALAVDPCQRYASADEMKQEVEDFLLQLGETTSPPALSVYMESTFPAEREKLEAAVDHALARASAQPVSQRRILASDLCDSGRGTFRTTSYEVPLDAQESTGRRPQQHGFLVAAAAAAALAVGVAFVAHAPSGGQNGWLGSLLAPTPAVAAGASMPPLVQRRLGAATARDGSLAQDVDSKPNVPPPSTAQAPARLMETPEGPPKAGDKRAPREHPLAR
jgi:eukaryotic-like serine/threonine-protein kinase